MIAAMRQASTLGSGRRFKADGKPGTAAQVSFEQVLIEAGIDLDNCNEMGATCLMYAASSGREGVVELLLNAGADPYIRNFDDARAVDLAASLGCLKRLRHTAN